MTRPTVALVDLNAIVDNFLLAQSLSAEGQCVAVVKANAYGHGLVAVAKALAKVAPVLAVARIDEAKLLRAAAIATPILLLEGALDDAELQCAAQLQCWLVIENENQLEAISRVELVRPVKAWLKLDTGMHRLGLPVQRALAAHDILSASANVEGDVVIMTHLASADEPDTDSNHQQSSVFLEAVKTLNRPLSIANSAALLAMPRARAQWNRPGYMLYGGNPLSSASNNTPGLKCAMTFKSRVISLRTIEVGERVGYSGSWCAQRRSVIATVAAGYGDGYPRGARNGTPVLVRGQRAFLAGTVSMDMISVDVSDLPDIAIGDEVILWGDGLSVDEVAQCAGTIGYELLAGMPARTPRQYIELGSSE